MKYKVRVSELRYGEVEVDAASEREAKSKATRTGFNFFDSEITDLTAEKMASNEPKDVIERLESWANGDTCDGCPAKDDTVFQATELLRKAYPKKTSVREDCLRKATEIVCGEREDQYGSPEDNFAMIAELWSAYMKHSVKAEDVALLMALLKIARVSTGAYKADSYIDLAGYAACGMEIASKKSAEVRMQDEPEPRTYIVTETCPHCESEIEMVWNTEERGFKAFCPVCGKRLMLCDECLHTGKGRCDYSNDTDSCRYNPAAGKKLWMRLGVMLNITDEEAEIIFGEDESLATDTLREIISAGRVRAEGDCYIPMDCIEDFNKTYGTNFETCDTGFDL